MVQAEIPVHHRLMAIPILPNLCPEDAYEHFGLGCRIGFSLLLKCINRMSRRDIGILIAVCIRDRKAQDAYGTRKPHWRCLKDILLHVWDIIMYSIFSQPCLVFISKINGWMMFFLIYDVIFYCFYLPIAAWKACISFFPSVPWWDYSKWFDVFWCFLFDDFYHFGVGVFWREACEDVYMVGHSVDTVDIALIFHNLTVDQMIYGLFNFLWNQGLPVFCREYDVKVVTNVAHEEVGIYVTGRVLQNYSSKKQQKPQLSQAEAFLCP